MLEQPFQDHRGQKLRTSTPGGQDRRSQNAVAHASLGLWERGVSGPLFPGAPRRPRGARRTGTASGPKTDFRQAEMSSAAHRQRWPQMTRKQEREKYNNGGPRAALLSIEALSRVRMAQVL